MEFCDNFAQKLLEIRNNPVYNEYISMIKERYVKEVAKPVYATNYSEFMEFFESGDRFVYENNYFSRRARLTLAVILYLYYEEDKYLKEICNMVWILCGEITWCLPAHLNKERDRIFHNYRRQIDLFAAETGSTLAEIYNILYDKLPVGIKEAIKYEVDDRIFKGFENQNYWWERKTNNWSAVCAGNVGLAYMYLAPERFEKVKPRLLSAMEYFLSSYGEDGCCVEGVGYWSYGFSNYIYFADALYRFSAGKEDIRHSKKIDNIATYIKKMVMRGDICVSFSDASRQCEFSNLGLMSYIAENYENFNMPRVGWSCGGQQVKLSIALRNLFWCRPDLINSSSEQEVPLGMDYFKDAQWYINRKKTYSFAAKCGHNDEEHNHNDVGSFIFAGDRGQILVDIGSMLYTRDNFNDKRYTFLQNSSLGHNVPILDGKAQKAGRNYHGKVMKVSEEEFVLEIQDAYGENMPKIIRSFILEENGVVLTDEISPGYKSVTERFVSFIEPEITSNGLKIGNGIIKCPAAPEIQSVDMLNHGNKMERYYLIDYKADAPKFSVKMEVVK